MEEKIDLLRNHLPEFLVENRKVYSILSIGLHELDEEECLAHFDLMKHSIITILEDDKRKREELEQKKAFTTAIAKFEKPKRPVS